MNQQSNARRAFASSTRLFSITILVLISLATHARAATVLEKTVEHLVHNDGSVLETTRLRVQLDSASDHALWSPYRLTLDSHHSLEQLRGTALLPSGEIVEARVEIAQEQVDGSFHSSHQSHLVSFPSLPSGSMVSLQSRVLTRPHFPEGVVVLGERSPIERLDVSVRSARGAQASGWRWAIEGEIPGADVSNLESGVRARGSSIAATPLTGYGQSTGAVLRYAWGDSSSWSDIGEWYRTLLPETRSIEDVAALLAQILEPVGASRDEIIAAIYRAVQEDIRYVAVQLGIGSLRASEPSEVIARAWGDCKDQGVLLIALLEEAGIPAYPALINALAGGSVNTSFPSPSQFTHLIVAVPQPDSEKLLFLDPTQQWGSAGWLHPVLQGRRALIAAPGHSRLATVPLLDEVERRELAVEVRIGVDGVATGKAELSLSGNPAIPFIEHFAPHGRQGRTDLTSVFSPVLPGAAVDDSSYRWTRPFAPTIDMSGRVQISNLVQSGGTSKALRLGSMVHTPDLRQLDEAKGAVAVTAGSTRSLWRVSLPAEWCLPRSTELRVENHVGSFHQTVTPIDRADGTLAVEVDRRLVLRTPRVESSQLSALRELAAAERRAARRRVRMSCGTQVAAIDAEADPAIGER